MADFAMVGALVALLFAALVQLGVVLDVRNTMIDCVSEGARFGALADRSPADGAERARELIEESLPSRFAADVTATRTSGGASGDQVEVTARAPFPLFAVFGAPGGLGTLVVRGHGAVQELP